MMRKTITLRKFLKPEYDDYTGRLWYQEREIDVIKSWDWNTGWERARTFALILAAEALRGVEGKSNATA